jgi:tight adherence protein C
LTQENLLLLLLLCAGIVLLVGISAALMIREARRRDLEGRIIRAVSDGTEAKDDPSRLGTILRSVGERARRGGRLYSANDIEHLELLILSTGRNPKKILPLLLGAKLLLMIVLPFIALIVATLLFHSLQTRIAVIGGGVLVGVLGPELILRWLRRPYLAALQRGAPDALDLLVVCSEAGMGLESALERVSRELMLSNRQMAVALSTLLDDLRILPDRRAAFAKFGTRSGVEGLQRMATMLGQSLQYGTPLSHALRAVAAELRRQRMDQLEERAVKLPAKLIFPMVGFIMPSLYIVLLGTSFMRLYDSLGHLTSQAPTH